MAPIQTLFRLLGGILLKRGVTFFKKNWFKGILLLLLFYGFHNKEISFEVSLSSLTALESSKEVNQRKAKQQKVVSPSQLGLGSISFGSKTLNNERTKQIKKEAQLEKASIQSVCSFIFSGNSPGKHPFDSTLVSKHYQLCEGYLKRFKPVALGEERKYGVPASIKLAQALLESDAGQSILAQNFHNHFGIQCGSNTTVNCTFVKVKGQGANYRQYENAWISFRKHSLFLQNERYKFLFDIPISDYTSWAKGLQNAGYSADPDYAKQLIQIIEFFHLND